MNCHMDVIDSAMDSQVEGLTAFIDAEKCKARQKERFETLRFHPKGKSRASVAGETAPFKTKDPDKGPQKK